MNPNLWLSRPDRCCGNSRAPARCSCLTLMAPSRAPSTTPGPPRWKQKRDVSSAPSRCSTLARWSPTERLPTLRPDYLVSDSSGSSGAWRPDELRFMGLTVRRSQGGKPHVALLQGSHRR